MMGFTLPNPLDALRHGVLRFIEPRQEQTESTHLTQPLPRGEPDAHEVAVAVPDSSQESETTIVHGHFVADEQSAPLSTEAHDQTERFRQIVETFDEDKQEALEWVIRKGATFFCYLAPFVLAVPVGLAVGDVFTASSSGSPLMKTVWASFAIHLLSVCLEVLLPILGLATTIAFKRVVKDRGKVTGFLLTACFFLLVSIGNSMALLFLMEQGLGHVTDVTADVALLGRSFGPLIIDIGSTVYLSISGVKSLQKYLADQRAKITAIRDVNHVNIEMEQTTIKAAIDRQTAVMDMHSKQHRAQTWNQIEAMQSQAMIEQARRNMLESGEQRGGYRRSSW